MDAAKAGEMSLFRKMTSGQLQIVRTSTCAGLIQNIGEVSLGHQCEKYPENRLTDDHTQSLERPFH